LYIQLPDGTVVSPALSDDALIIMIGEAGAQWLAPKLGAPFRALPHALYAGLSSPQSIGDGVSASPEEGKEKMKAAATRAW
jgi:hypothetical protein